VALATSAAPTYLPQVAISNVLNDPALSLIDGGLNVNNPARVALSTIAGGQSNPDVLLVSLGTGDATALNPISFRQANSWSKARWARPAVQIAMDGNSKETHRQLMVDLPTRACSLGCRRYFRFQVKLHKGLEDMDNADVKNLRALSLLSEDLIEENRDTLRSLCDRL